MIKSDIWSYMMLKGAKGQKRVFFVRSNTWRALKMLPWKILLLKTGQKITNSSFNNQKSCSCIFECTNLPTKDEEPKPSYKYTTEYSLICYAERLFNLMEVPLQKISNWGSLLTKCKAWKTTKRLILSWLFKHFFLLFISCFTF